MLKISLLISLISFTTLKAQLQKIDLDYFPYELIPELFHLKGAKKTTIYNTLVINGDTLLKKDAVKWYKYTNDSISGWMNKTYFGTQDHISQAFEERYEDKCMVNKKLVFEKDWKYEPSLAMRCRFLRKDTFYQEECFYYNEELRSKNQITHTMVNDSTQRKGWREWRYDTLVVDSAKVTKYVRYKDVPGINGIEESIYGSNLTRDAKGKLHHYSRISQGGYPHQFEYWYYIYRENEQHPWRIDYDRWTKISITYNHVPLIWLSDYKNDTPTRVTYLDFRPGREVSLLVELVIE